jgi:hypothetical protein
MFSPSMPAPTPAPEPPKKDDPAVEEARRRELATAAKARGRAATILTGTDGAAGDAPVQHKRLLGE